MDIKEVALIFVNSLVPGKFDRARSMLSSDCIYCYGNENLTGDSIIQSFIENHENAKAKLDKIEYIDGKVTLTDENIITITVQDKIEKDGFEHIYKDRLVLTIEQDLVSKIEYRPFPEERDKLKLYLSKVTVEL